MHIYPSLLAVWDKTNGDTTAIMAAALAAQAAGAVALHLDFMAPPFTPRTTFAPEIIPHLRAAGVNIPLDCHLMTGLNWVPLVATLAPEYLTFHAKMAPNHTEARRVLEQVACQGIKGGLALDHDEAVAPLAALLAHPACYKVTLLTVAAGEGGQPLQPNLLGKVAEIHALNPRLQVVIDGGVNHATLATVAATGAHAAVAGSAVFGAQSVAEGLNLLKLKN